MDDKKDYGFLTEDMYKVEFLQQAIQDFINSGVPDIDPLNPTESERAVLIDYFHHFYALMEFQSILYTRLKLMKEEKLIGIETAIVMICEVLGMRPDESIIQFHQNMKAECKIALTDLTGENMDDYEGIDVDFQW
jgi:hypothetical protein